MMEGSAVGRGLPNLTAAYIYSQFSKLISKLSSAFNAIAAAAVFYSVLLFVSFFVSFLVSLSSSSALADSTSHVIELEWEAIDGVTAYQVELTRLDEDGDKEKPIYKKTETTKWSPKVKPGNYLLRIRAYDQRGVAGGWSEASPLQVVLPAPKLLSPKPGEKIQAKSDDSHKTQISWQSVSGTAEYKVFAESMDGSFKDDWKTNKNSLEVDLDVAKNYKFRVQPFGPDGMPGENSAWQNFSVLGSALEKPEPVKPLTEIVEKLEWKGSDQAASYQYDLLRKIKGNKWTFVEKKKSTKDKKIAFDMKNPSGVYMLRVKAKAPLRGDSESAKLTFKVRGGFRSPAAVQDAILAESLKKPTHFYGIGSYFISQASYSGLNKEKSGQEAGFSSLTGTGRIGLGYQHPEYKWGVYGVADFAGIVVDGQNSTFASVEGHGTWMLSFWGATQILFSGGLYMKELPEITGNSIDGLQSFDKITNMGPHAGFKFWRPINEKYGIQANARVYLPLAGSSPTGEPIKTLPSYQLGLLGSYRWSANILGLLGYAYRIDQAAYDARSFEEIGDGFASDGDVNQIQLQGHYLNLMLEYSF